MYDDHMILDFFKMKLIMNRDNSSNAIDTIFTMIMIMAIPHIIEQLKKLNLSWNDFTFKKKHILVIEGKRALKSSSWCFKYRNLFSDDFRAMWNHINMKNKFKDIYNIKAIYGDDEEIEYNNDNDNENDKDNDTQMYIINQKSTFYLTKDILCYIHSSDNSEQSDKIIEVQGPIDTISIELFSYTKNVYNLKEFVDKTTELYLDGLEKKRNGRKFIYTLDQEYSEDKVANKWHERDFLSNRTFDNMFFPQKESLLKQLIHFRDNKHEYDKHGDPYTLGICLYGPPGTGKTCIAKSIANMFQRHLVELPLDCIKTKSEFKKSFFESKYNTKNKAGAIDFDKKIILLEDIDCMSDIVFEREDKYKNRLSDPDGVADISDASDTSDAHDAILEKLVDVVSHVDNKTITATPTSKYFSKDTSNDLTLSFILNILDGVQETPGRIMIMTSNYIQKIDKALKRPGRIDLCLELGYVTVDTVKEFYHFHYEKGITANVLSELNIEKLTPAELVNIRRSCDNGKQFISRLRQRIYTP